MARMTRYMFNRYEQNMSFSCFLAVFGFQGDLQRDLKTRYVFESYDQKLIVFVVYVRFHELLPTIFGIRR